MTLWAIILPPHTIKHVLLPILRVTTRIRQVQHALADLGARQSPSWEEGVARAYR